MALRVLRTLIRSLAILFITEFILRKNVVYELILLFGLIFTNMVLTLLDSGDFCRQIAGCGP